MQNLSELYEKNKIKSHELPKTFAIRRDFALLLNLDIMYSEIEKTILDLKIPHLIDLKLFDVYEGDKIAEGKKSYAVAFYFQDKNDTLKDAIIDKYMKKIETLLSTQFKAQLR